MRKEKYKEKNEEEGKIERKKDEEKGKIQRKIIFLLLKVEKKKRERERKRERFWDGERENMK